MPTKLVLIAISAVGIAGALFLYLMTEYVPEVVTPPSPKENLTCSKTLDMDPRTRAYNATAVDCIQTVLEGCQPLDVLLTYNFGSMHILTQGVKDGKCTLQLEHEIEMGRTTYSCEVPPNELRNWKSWRNAGGGGALDDISTYCSPE